MSSTYYLTTPIYYVNDKPHIGHAYTTLACDTLARFQRLDGRRVLFLTGTDEHGQKVEKAATATGIEPQDFVDSVSANFQKMNEFFNISHDDFIRTTQDRHINAAQALWRRLAEREAIYLDRYAGWYAVRDEAFYTDSELISGPHGTQIAPSGAPVEWVEEESYFFRLSKWQQPLLDFYQSHPDFMAPASRRNEVIRFVEGGLRDLSISRTGFQWGIPVPDDPHHVMYVWIDALANYLTAAGYPEDTDECFGTLWPADLHVIGKDILRFHAVYWPAFLLAAGLEPPRRIFAHGWWTNEGEKISKSLGNVIDPFALAERYGLDSLRYFLLRAVPFGQDGDFSQATMIQLINADLSNDFGNLSQRVLSMIHKNCHGAVPVPETLTAPDQELLSDIDTALPVMREAMHTQAFHKALDCLWGHVGAANRYVDNQAPWALKKTDPARMATVLYVLAESIRCSALLAQPFIPDGAKKILDQLSVLPQQREFSTLGREGRLEPGTKLPKPEGVFPRYESQ